jgi:hypothetical protein
MEDNNWGEGIQVLGHGVLCLAKKPGGMSTIGYSAGGSTRLISRTH